MTSCMMQFMQTGCAGKISRLSQMIYPMKRAECAIINSKADGNQWNFHDTTSSYPARSQ